MIISDKNKRTVISPRTVALALLAILLLAVFLLFSKKSNSKKFIDQQTIIFCDAENVAGEYFVTNNLKFTNAATRSDAYALSGSYSSKTEKGEGFQYGFGYKIENPVPGDKYKASVWRYRDEGGQGFLVVAGKGAKGDFYKSEELFEKTKGPWELIEITFTVPIVEELNEIHIYVYSKGSREMFFDDLKIQKLGNLKKDLKDFKLDTLQITLEEKGMQQLQRKRSEAFRNKILETSDTDWVRGTILDKEGNAQKMRLRLKGDWLDHLQEDKWSFRIKMGNNEAWNRLRYFSVQTPAARSYLHEWVLHKLYEREDVLTTYYDFILLDINGTSKGVYALEEHFDKVLVESKQRREGPIIKFREDGFWESIKRQINTVKVIQHELKQNEKDWSASDIRPFQEKTILSSPTLTEQFEVAQDLLYQYQQGQPINEVFDLERLAKYYAINDVLGAYHGIAWHNQRFYYNPLIGKLEPIGFDGFAQKWRDRSYFLGQGALNKASANGETLDRMLFMNEDFTGRYMHYLYRFSSKAYLQSFFADISDGIKSRERLLLAEFEHSKFDEAECMLEALGIHILLLPQNNVSVKAHASPSETGGQLLKVANVYSMPVELLGYGHSVNNINKLFDEPVILPGHMPRKALMKMNETNNEALLLDTFTRMDGAKNYQLQSPLNFKQLEVGEQAQYLFFRPLGLDTVFHSAIVLWSAPKKIVPPLQVFAKANMTTNEMYRVTDQVVYFTKGEHQISQALVFPKGYRIHFEAGTKLDLINNAFFLSHSPVFMYGTEEAPIIISSSDKTGRGFHLMETQKESELKHCIFDNLNTVNERGWTLTGAVTFYEADATFYNCLFTNSLCEDAINMIRSEFNLESCVISNTFADGLDSDFCKGLIRNSNFNNTGNDGLDLSGSVIRIENVSITNAGDKGISVGEETDATIFSADINGAPIAVAAKDLSTLLIHDIKITDCRQGFTAFQKKPEFGGSKIVVYKYQAENVKKLYSIQKSCSLQLEKKLIVGK